MVSVLAIVAWAACGPPPEPRTRITETETRPLEPGRALARVREVLDEERVGYARDWSIDIGAAEPLEVDLRLEDGPFGIEWVTPQDRADYGDAIPEPDPDGQLRILPGEGNDARAQVLVLDADSYHYAQQREHVERGVSGVGDAEARLRRDVRDFLSYVRGQGGP